MTTCARSGRCLSAARTFQRTVYRPGEICQFDLWETEGRDPGRPRPDPPGLGRRGVPGLLARRRRGADLLQADPGLLFGIRRCLWSLGALPQTLVWDRQAGLHAGGGRPTDGVRRVLRRSCGSAGTSASRRDPQAKGVVERLQDFMDAASSRAGVRERARLPAAARLLVRRAREPADAQDAARRPIDRLIEEREVMAPLPATAPDIDRRGCCASPPDPYLRFDTCDYSLDPRLVGRRVEARVDRARDHRRRAGHRRARVPARRARSPSTARSPRSSTPAR